MSKQRYPEEFKTEAVRQITERGHKVADVSPRLGVSQHSLYQWIKAHRMPAAQRQAQGTQADELRKLKAEIKRVTVNKNASPRGGFFALARGQAMPHGAILPMDLILPTRVSASVFCAAK